MNTHAQSDYNKWSLEVNGGFNKAMGPLSPGYYSPTLNVGHFEIGSRYMFNEFFGLKGNLGIGNFSEIKGKSPIFSSDYLVFTTSGVVNLGRLLNFHFLEERLTILGFLGGGVGNIDFNEPAVYSFAIPEYYYLATTGVSALYRINEKISLTGNIGFNVNGRQTFTLDGNLYNAPFQPIPPGPPYIHATGTWWTGTLGLSFYVGNYEKHADWYIAPDKYVTKEQLATQINGINDMLKDSDGDGIPDYLDKEPSTPAGARVDSFGNTLDSDGDGIPDHLDKCPFQPGPASTNGCPPLVETVAEVDYLKKAINDGYVNVYYAFDSSKPLGYSVSAAQYVSNFMKRNPGVSMEIKGFADEIGPEDYNMKLSERRAKAVYDLLISSGVNVSRLTYKGYGEDTSVDKTSADARQLARRASFEVK
ncbi:MAG: OmpA family protein [Algoriphagus sp.]